MIDLYNINAKQKDTLLAALNSVCLGKTLGTGSYRTVHELYDKFTGLVVKISTEHAHTSNVMERTIWLDHEKTKHKKWLAGCFFLSDCGKALVQERLDIITSVNDPRLPKRIPRLFADTKVNNWGVDRNGVVKCVDYGNFNLLTNNPWQLKKSEWWIL